MGYVFTRRPLGGYPPNVATTVGNNIRRLREAAGYKTQGKFATALKVPQSRLSDWENDRYGVPEVPNLLKIAKTLKVSLDALLEGVDEEYDAMRLGPESISDDDEAAARVVDLQRRFEDQTTIVDAVRRLSRSLTVAVGERPAEEPDELLELARQLQGERRDGAVVMLRRLVTPDAPGATAHGGRDEDRSAVPRKRAGQRGPAR